MERRQEKDKRLHYYVLTYEPSVLLFRGSCTAELEFELPSWVQAKGTSYCLVGGSWPSFSLFVYICKLVEESHLWQGDQRWYSDCLVRDGPELKLSSITQTLPRLIKQHSIPCLPPSLENLFKDFLSYIEFPTCFYHVPKPLQNDTCKPQR